MLPASLSALTALSTVILTGATSFDDVPVTTLDMAAVAGLPALEYLAVYGFEITRLPAAAGGAGLRGLRDLVLAHCTEQDGAGGAAAGNSRLRAFPAFISGLTGPESLRLHGNAIRVVPDWVGRLTSLIRLDLACQAIVGEAVQMCVPVQLAELRALRSLELDCHRYELQEGGGLRFVERVMPKLVIQCSDGTRFPSERATAAALAGVDRLVRFLDDLTEPLPG